VAFAAYTGALLPYHLYLPFVAARSPGVTHDVPVRSLTATTGLHT
jgi:hypothetical protein